jgi:hypothetical protein
MSPDVLRESVRSQLEQEYPDQYAVLVASNELQQFLDERLSLYNQHVAAVQADNPSMSPDQVSEYVYYTYIRLPDQDPDDDEPVSEQ